MCRADEPISIQFPIARALTADIHAIGDPDLQQVRDSILRLLEEKFNVKNEKIHGLVIFLDPRFKDRIASNKIEFNANMTSWIQEECEQEADVPINNNDSEINSPPPKRSNSFSGRHSQLFNDEIGVEEERACNAIIEMKAYCKVKCVDPEEDPLEFWKENERMCPILAKLARIFLSAPATSQPSEQLFLIARDVGNIIDINRSMALHNVIKPTPGMVKM
uniref:HAT C-terminal dimerisation domain-containing protein n=1 Tax=Acrobeloides nanus TaxID=290746 RepID=A0A914E4G0_9BILA